MTREIVTEALVEQVVAYGLEPFADGAKKAAEVALVLVVVEAAARFAQAVRLVVAVGFENVTGLEEDLTVGSSLAS